MRSPKIELIFKRALPTCLFFVLLASQAISQDLVEPTPSPTPSPIFTDRAAGTGLNFNHFNGMTGQLFLPEIMGSGAALFDYDNDGDLDVFFVQGRVLEPGKEPKDAIYAWESKEPPKGRLFRNDLTIQTDDKEPFVR